LPIECRNLGEADGAGKKHDYVAGVLSAHETGEAETLIPIYALSYTRYGYFWKVIENRVRFRMCSNSIAIEIKADRREFRLSGIAFVCAQEKSQDDLFWASTPSGTTRAEYAIDRFAVSRYRSFVHACARVVDRN